MDSKHFDAEAFERERSKIINSVRYQDGMEEPPSELYHYTSFEAATKIVTTNSLWLSHSMFLNDPTESEHGRNAIRKTAEKHGLKSVFDQCDADQFLYGDVQPFVFCLSRQKDSLPLWEMYAGRNGCCISFGAGIEEICFKGPPAVGTLGSVIYCRRDQETLANELCKQLARIRYSAPESKFQREALVSLINCTVFLKNPVFSHEREWRIVYMGGPNSRAIQYRAGKRFPIPYVEGSHSQLPIKTITVGPADDQERLISSMRHVLRMNGHDSVKVEKSDISFSP